jgi:hypothetical protein
MFKEHFITNSLDKRVYRQFYVCSKEGVANIGKHIYFLCCSPNCNQEFRNDDIKNRQIHQCGIVDRLQRRK